MNIVHITESCGVISNWTKAHIHVPPAASSRTSANMPSAQYEFPDPTTLERKKAFRTKQPSKFYDPCAEASANSMKCLDLNNYEKSKCQEAFDAYKECKRLWVPKPEGYQEANGCRWRRRRRTRRIMCR